MEKKNSKLCRHPDCQGWATRSGFCVGHDTVIQATATQVARRRRNGIKLPSLNSVDAAKEWLKLIGRSLSRNEIKPQLASELRRIASTYCDLDPGSAISDRLEQVEDVLKRLVSKEEPWQG